MDYPAGVPRLTDGVVTLRAISLDDLDLIVSQCQDPETIAWTTIPTPYTRDDGITWITKLVPEGWADGSNAVFAIEAEHPDGVRRYSGTVDLRASGDGIGDLGFVVHPVMRGHGIARRAITLLADYAFGECGLEVLTWYAYVGNWASRRVVWSAGFSIDGMVAQFRVQRGQRRDAWFGTLRAGDPREPTGLWWIPPVLETERLRLRPFADADADRLIDLFHDERSQHFGGRTTRVIQRDGAAQLLRIREQCARGAILNWCIAARDTDQLVGHIQLFDFDGLDDTEVKPGYSIHPDSRGRGYLTEALHALTDWTFLPAAAGGLGKRLITISTAGTNAASRHAATQAGFTHTATHPASFPLPTTFDDEVIYQRLNPSWQPEPDTAQ
jgi:RimJ/RimL family protein N-acetyltransferase